MPLINCEVIFILTCSSTCVITNSTGAETFTITDTKASKNVPIVALSPQDNAKLLQKSSFKRTINWNKLHLKTYPQNQYLNHLIYPSFQGVNIIFVLYFDDGNDRI